MKLYNEEGPNNKRPAAETRLIEEPPLNNLNHIYELYEESGSDNENIEDCNRGLKSARDVPTEGRMGVWLLPENSVGRSNKKLNN